MLKVKVVVKKDEDGYNMNEMYIADIIHFTQKISDLESLRHIFSYVMFLYKEGKEGR